VGDERPPARLDRGDPDGLLNARSDPASAAFCTLGSEAGSFVIGACVGAVGLVATTFIRSVPRGRPTKTA